MKLATCIRTGLTALGIGACHPTEAFTWQRRLTMEPNDTCYPDYW